MEEKGKEQATEQVTPTTPTTPTAPPLPIAPPPPYPQEPACPQEPAQPIMGQYPLLETTELGGQMEGTFTVTLTKNTKKEQLKRRKPLTPRKRLPMEETLLSDTESTDGSIADEEDEEAEAPEIELLRHEPQNRRVSGGAWTTDMELTGLVGQEEAPPSETQAPPEKRHKDQKRRQLKEKDTRPHHSSCHDLRRREFRHPQKEKQERLLKYQSTPDMEGLLDREMERIRKEWWRQRATVDPPPGPSRATSPVQVEGCHQSPYVENDCGDVAQKMQELIERTNERLDHMTKEIEALEEETRQPQGPKQGPKDPNLTPTKKHVTLRLQGTMETDKGRTEERQDTDSECAPYDSAAPSGSLSTEGMKLRNGRVIRVLKTAEEEDEDSEGSPMCPLVTKTNGRQQYEPWPFMDMIGLAERLPVLTDGADKWILALEETTAGIRLALGDIKAILMYVAGKQTTQEILTDAGLTAAFGTNINDGVEFGRYRSRVWAQLRKHYPAKRDPSKLEGETMGEDECPSKFLHNFQKRWKEETGEAWNANKTTQSLFKMMVKKAMPEEVQRRLEGVVGLMKMEWPLFTEHIVHHVELYKKDKKKKEEDDKQLANKLTQLQLGELSKQVKKEKEKAKIQAPMRAMTLLLMPHITITTTSHKCQEEVAASDPPEGEAEEETVDGEGAETTHPTTSRVIRSNPVSNREPIRLHLITSVGGVDSQATYELSALATHGTVRHKIVHGKAQHKIGPIHNSHTLELTPQRHPYPGLEPGREQFPQIRKGTARPPRGQKETKQKGMATPPHWNRGQEGQHVLHRDAGQRQPRAMAAVQPRVRAAGRYQRGYQQWPRAHQRGAPQPPGLAANLNLMSHHLLEIGKIMRGQVQRERWLQRQKDRREREQRQREKKEKKALAQNQVGVGLQGGQTQDQAQVQTQTQTQIQTQDQETQTQDNQTQKREQPPGKREGLKSRGGAKVGVIVQLLIRRTMASVAGQFVIIDQSSPPKTITEIYENMGGHEGKELKDFNQSTGLDEGNLYEIMAPGKILSQDDQTWGSGEEEYEEIV
ncbi:hypothetical protein ABVT39_012960 [Epinephelus coioides]